jgi:hypothetical protein
MRNSVKEGLMAFLKKYLVAIAIISIAVVSIAAVKYSFITIILNFGPTYTYTNSSSESYGVNLTDGQDKVIANNTPCNQNQCVITAKDVLGNIYFLYASNLQSIPFPNVSFKTPDNQIAHVPLGSFEKRTYAVCLNDNSTCIIFPEYR